MKSIEGLGQLTKLRLLNVSGCPKLQKLFGVEHVMSLKLPGVEHWISSERLYVNKLPKLKWVTGVLEEVQQLFKELLPRESNDDDVISPRKRFLLDDKVLHREMVRLCNFLNLT